MQPTIFLASLAALLPFALADGKAEFNNLHVLVTESTTQILNSLNTSTHAGNLTANSTSVFVIPTSVPQYKTNATQLISTPELIDRITAAVKVSKDTLLADPIAFVNFVSSDILDGAYLEYINEVPTFASVISAQGRILSALAHHFDSVISSVIPKLQALGEEIQSFSIALRRHGLLTPMSTIRTARAVGALSRAQAEWPQSGANVKRDRVIRRSVAA